MDSPLEIQDNQQCSETLGGHIIQTKVNFMNIS